MMERASTALDGRVEFLNPDGLSHNPAFSNVAVVSGSVRTIYIGGQDAVDAEGNIVGIGDIAAQTEQVLRNLRTALAAAGAGPEHVVKWNVLVVDGQDFGAGYAAFQRVWGDQPNPPVITAAVVKGLAHPDFLVEMDAIAVVPATGAAWA
jgi:enamine deaminase RidA (YjgF/YER057c/UK114 family)